MRMVRIILQVCILWLFFQAGEFVVSILNLEFPASIVGLLLLFCALYLKWIPVKVVADGANTLIAFLTLFFIPTTVGIIEYPELLEAEGLLLICAVAISSLFAFIVTGRFAKIVEMYERKKRGNHA